MLYDNYRFSVFMCSICIVAKSVSLVFFISSYFVSRNSSEPDTSHKNPTIDSNLNINDETKTRL